MYQPLPPTKSRRLQFLDQISPDYLESLEFQYQNDPDSLSNDWAFFFEAFRLGQGEKIIERVEAQVSAATQDSTVIDELRVLEMISMYRLVAHLVADIDPLGMRKPPFEVNLDLKTFKLDGIDKNRLFQAALELGLPPSTIDQVVKHLKSTYLERVAVEFVYIRDPEISGWLKKRIDQFENATPFSNDQKKEILKHLACANHFENFLQLNYTGQKRFSIEGGECLIPAMKRVIELSSDLGAEEVMIGMAHRGRLNVLVNVLQRPSEELFKEFEGAELPEFVEATGDVKYHQGFSNDIQLPNGKKIHLSLAPNPSHLEFVNPVVEGMVRAKLEDRYKNDESKIVPMIIHGDAAVIGQGIVPETLNLSLLKGYRTGGTIHIVINNQIGFTTSPTDARSTYYCTDHAKSIQCPVFHVNGNDPEAVVHAIEIATEYRMKFRKDVFVDIVCYRKYGHNEGDEPRFTQPQMYEIIGKQKNPFQLYRDKCIEAKVCDAETADGYISEIDGILKERRSKIQNAKRILQADSLKGQWQGFKCPNSEDMIAKVDTSIASETMDLIIDKIHEFPKEMKIMPKFRKMFDARRQKIDGEDEIDWAVGEALGFGSVILDGYNLRLSGQDSTRGTFSHRHAAFTDTDTLQKHYPLQNLKEGQKTFQVFDSPLSEAGVLGFDYGYSLSSPQTLVIWEAQFGDFANGAQVIIDQFISSGETKWYRMSGIVLLLPHGYEGQGPEHSSARLERFIQLCSQNNMQVCYPTTPAQICHLLRRQMNRPFRKPLIVMTPKSLLRHPMAISRKSDFTKGSFYTILEDKCKSPERVILCSGKVYYDLKKKALESNVDDKILLVRVEQLYPLDQPQLQALRQKWDKLPWVWCQEEPKNMGAWFHMKLKFIEWNWNLDYVGRPPSASPATGSHLQHMRELEKLLIDALGL